MAEQFGNIVNLAWNNKAWAIRNADVVIGGLSRAVKENFSTKQDDAASRGDYAGNGSGTQLEVCYRSHSDSYEENQRKMELAKKQHKNGWK